MKEITVELLTTKILALLFTTQGYLTVIWSAAAIACIILFTYSYYLIMKHKR